MENKNVKVPNGYKKTELGAIPEEWEVVKLGDEKYFQIVSGGTPSRDNPDFWTNGSINWATPTDITKNKGYFLDSTKEKINENGLKNSSAKIIPKGSVLLTSRATIGAVAINNVDLATNQGFANFVLTGAVCNYYLLLTLEFNKQKLESLCGQSTFKEVSKKTLKDFKILMPSLPQQQKIASILSKVDEQIEHTERIIEKTELLKKGLMQKLLTKGIGHTKFKKTELGEIPEEWEVIKLGDEKYLKIVSGGTPSRDNPKYWTNGTIYWATPTDITKNKGYFLNSTNEKISEKGLHNSSAKIIPKGSVLMTSRATIGAVAINNVDLATNQGFANFIPTKKLVCNYHLLISLEFNKCKLESLAGQSTFKEVSKKSLKNFEIPLPTLAEQQKIASILSKVDSQIQDNQNYLIRLQELKKGLMQDLLTGKIRVKN